MLGMGGLSSAFAQAGATVASIEGVVADETGAQIGGATITAKNLGTNTALEVTSNEDGSYIFPALTPGNYEIKVSAAGFTTQIAKLPLALGTVVKAKVTLKIESGQDIIEVKADANVNQQETASVSNIDNARIDNLPINTRDFLNFALTSPRATADRTAAAVGISKSSGISFNGQSGRFNYVTIDGVDNNNVYAGGVRTTFSQDAVQEYQVVSDSFSAEFGRALGGIVNIVTKGGTNDIRGSIFFINRNDAIAAKNPFAPFKSEFKQYQFGATLSGPIKKDRVFYFTSFERRSIKDAAFVNFPDRIIASAQRLGYITQNGARPFSFDETSFLGRVDIPLGNADKLYIRYNYAGRYDGFFEPFGGVKSEEGGDKELTNDNSLAIANTYISAKLNLVNETRFLYNHRNFSTLGTGDLPNTQVIDTTGKYTFGNSIGSMLAYTENSENIVDNVTLNRGNHLFKFGVDYDHHVLPETVAPFQFGLTLFAPLNFGPMAPPISGLEAFDPSLRSPAQRGFLTFLSGLFSGGVVPGFPPGVPLADLPLPAFYGQLFGDTHLELVKTSFSTFAQDDWKIRPNLMFKYGVRYDLSRERFVPDNNGNFSPRIALAYSPTQKINIHASYGMFFSSLFLLQTSGAYFRSGAVNIDNIPFPFSVFPYSLPRHRFPLLTGAGQTPGPVIPQFGLTFEFDPNLKTFYTQQSTLGIDYAIDNNTKISVNYTYVRGNRLFGERNNNPVINPVPNDPTSSQLFGRPNPTRGSVFLTTAAGDSYYHGVTISFDRRFANNFTFLAHYTLSKAIDNVSDLRPDLVDGPAFPLNLDQERSLSAQDARNRFVASGLWNLPGGKNAFTRDFQLSTIITLESGTPYNLQSGVDLNGDGDFPPTDRPFANGTIYTGFSTNGAPIPEIGRNTGVKPGFASVDVRLTRAVTIKERVRIQAFVEAFNLFNRVNIKDLNRVFPPDAQGKFNLPANNGQNGRYVTPKERETVSFNPRQFQFGFRFSF